LLAGYAEMAGWLYQDSGDTTAATWWSDRASGWAQAAGDHLLAAYLLIRKANIAQLDHSIVDLAAAQHSPGVHSTRLGALATQQHARGRALLGDTDAVARHLDHARTLLAAPDDDLGPDAPPYLHHHDLATLDEQAAGAYR
jgi:hypothetical protein